MGTNDCLVLQNSSQYLFFVKSGQVLCPILWLHTQQWVVSTYTHTHTHTHTRAHTNAHTRARAHTHTHTHASASVLFCVQHSCFSSKITPLTGNMWCKFRFYENKTKNMSSEPPSASFYSYTLFVVCFQSFLRPESFFPVFLFSAECWCL